jgi:membrane protease YdiL (CAAX protease family)
MSGDNSGNLVKDESTENATAEAVSTAAPAESPLPAGNAPTTFADRVEAILIGPQGIRWIWRLLAYLGMRKALSWLISDAVLYAQESGISYLWVIMVSETVFLVSAVVPAFALARVEKRSFGAYGLPARQAFGKMFCVGAVWGLAAVTILMLAMHGVGVFDFGHLALHGQRVLKFAVFWGVFFLLVALAEEFYLRGYAQFTLTDGIGFWPAALVLSIAFGALHFHNQGESMAGIMAAAVIGLFFCLTLRRTGTLWFAVGFHASWDWGETYLYSVPDSGMLLPGHLLKSSFHGPAWLTGGSVGPEGSALLFVLVALLWIAFDRVYPAVKYGRVTG